MVPMLKITAVSCVLAVALGAAASSAQTVWGVSPAEHALVSGDGTVYINGLPPAVYVYTPKHCAPGWTLVYVNTANSIISKCAAVGDLRDPE